MLAIAHWKTTKSGILEVLILALASFTLVRVARADGLADAFAACDSKKAGEACAVRIRDVELAGICTDHPAAHRLFCRPEHLPEPPAEAIAACEGKRASEPCSVQLDGHDIQGSCVQASDSRLFCALAPLPEPAR